MKKGCAAALAALLAAGCAAGGGFSAVITKEEQETDYSAVYAEIISFGGLSNKEYESELNSGIEELVRGAIAEFDSLAQEAAQSLPAGVKSDLRITQDVKRNSGGIVSFVTEQYTYLGGAHGNTVRYPETIDTRSENPHNLELSELFTDDSYIERINNLIAAEVKAEPEKYGELWAEPVITETTKYYLTDEELVIWFPPYELSYYAKGFIEFPIGLEDISGFLKEEYRITED